MNMQKRMNLHIIIFLSISCILLSYAMAGQNLPQSHAQIQIKGNDHKKLKTYFESLQQPPQEFDSLIERILIKQFPKSYTRGCSDMISKWGKDAKGSASSLVRVVFIKNHSKNLQQVFVAYTCFSKALGYGDRFYDERLALITIDSTSSSLTTLPNAPTCDSCSGLTRIGVDEEFQIGGKPAVSFMFATSNKNPCCDTSIVKEEIIEKFYILGSPEVKDALTLLKRRTEVYHFANKVDSTAAYMTDVNYEKDAKGDITKIVLTYEKLSNDISLHQGILWYTWNKKAKTFGAH